MQARFGLPPFEARFRPDVEVFFDEQQLQAVLRRRAPTRVFWCSMTDLFGPWVPDEWIDRIFGVMELAQQHTHQVLTKRPERMCEYLGRRWGARRWGEEPPYRAHIWPGVSVENRATLHRLDTLRATPAAVRFVSFEPLLEGLGDVDLAGIDQAICGGESGPGARPCDLVWIRRIGEQCRKYNCAWFVEQLGSLPIANVADEAILWAAGVESRGWFDPPPPDLAPGRRQSLRLRDRKGADPSEWPEDLRVRGGPR